MVSDQSAFDNSMASYEGVPSVEKLLKNQSKVPFYFSDLSLALLFAF